MLKGVIIGVVIPCCCVGRKLAERTSTAHKSKRTRTRISMEQRGKLNAFAEKAGWTIVGQRKETIEAACQDIGTLFIFIFLWQMRIAIAVRRVDACDHE